jgi:hypothetical protein
LLDANFTVVGLSPKIQQSDFDHPNFIALPAALTCLETAKRGASSRDYDRPLRKDVTGAAIPVYGGGL